MRTISPWSAAVGVLTLVGLVTSAGADAADAAAPDMRGTWKVDGSAIVAGATPHHPADAPPPAAGTKPRLRPFVGTLRVDGQEGDRFWGTGVSQTAASEDFIGSFTGEGRRFVAADSDGFFEGSVGEDGVIRYCYRHTTSASRVVSCGTARRE